MTLEAKTDEAVHVMTLRLPEGLYEVIRKRAFDERTSITSQIVVALRDKFESWGLGCDVCGKAHVVITTPGAIRFCAEHAPAPNGPARITQMPTVMDKPLWTVYCRECRAQSLMTDTSPSSPLLAASRDEHNHFHHAEDPSD